MLRVFANHGVVMVRRGIVEIEMHRRRKAQSVCRDMVRGGSPDPFPSVAVGVLMATVAIINLVPRIIDKIVLHDHRCGNRRIQPGLDL